LTNAQLKKKFDAMTEAQHKAMEMSLLKLAKSGVPKPDPNTMEGYALLQYTTNVLDELVAISNEFRSRVSATDKNLLDRPFEAYFGRGWKGWREFLGASATCCDTCGDETCNHVGLKAHSDWTYFASTEEAEAGGEDGPFAGFLPN
jgi:hypothetical protein